MKRILLAVLLALTAGAAHAATLTVGSCPPSSGLYSTIQAAIDAAVPGDTVQLCSQSTPYVESFNINTAITLDLNGQWIDWTNFTGNYAGWKNDSSRFSSDGFGGIVPGQVGLNPCTASGSCGIGQPTQWLPNTVYAAQVAQTYAELSFGVWPLITSVVNGNSPSRNYSVVTAGTSASSGGPTGTGSSITDGTVVWRYVGNYQSAIIKNGFLTGAGINYSGFASLGCIRGNSEGLLTVQNVAFIGCQVGMDYSNYKNSKLTLTDDVLYNNGLSYISPGGLCASGCGGAGSSHNMYITDIAELDLTRVVTTEATEGRTVKFRGNTLNMTNVITGSVYGGALNYPNGGLVTVTGSGGGSIWIAPASASCSSCKQLMTYADERYVGNDGVRRVSASNLISNTLIEIRAPVINMAFISPYYGTVTFDGTNTWYNSIVPSVPTDGPAPRVVGVPTSTTGTILTRAQMDTGIATDTASMTGPIQAVAAFAALLLYYDVNVPPWQASAAALGYSGPSAGHTITVATHPNFSAVHGTPYVAIAAGDYPGTAAPLATFTCSNTTQQNVIFGGAGGLGGGIADIDWGDSSPKRPDNFITATGGTNVPGSANQTTGGTLTVYGAHTYASAGSYTVTITIHELSPGTGTVTTTLTATVS